MHVSESCNHWVGGLGGCSCSRRDPELNIRCVPIEKSLSCSWQNVCNPDVQMSHSRFESTFITARSVKQPSGFFKHCQVLVAHLVDCVSRLSPSLPQLPRSDSSPRSSFFLSLLLVSFSSCHYHKWSINVPKNCKKNKTLPDIYSSENEL